MPTERRVYIIEIRPPWVEAAVERQAAAGRRCLYVGETGKAIEQRVAEHLAGDKRVAQCFRAARKAKGRARQAEWRDTPLLRGQDVWLRTKLFQRIPPAFGNEASEQQEAEVIDMLRRKGYIVFPKHAGSEPFLPGDASRR